MKVKSQLARATPEGRAKHNAAVQASQRKIRATVEGRAKHNAAVVRSLTSRLKTDGWYRCRTQLAKETRRLLAQLAAGKGFLNHSYIKLFGADRATVKAWFESMFRPGMGWHNYKVAWTCDHWWPVAMAQSDVELRQCFLLDNCSALTHAEHRLKTAADRELIRQYEVSV